MDHRYSYYPRKSLLLSLLLIAIVSLLAYSNTFNVPFQLDDMLNISAKPYVRDIGAFLDPAKIEHYRADDPFRMRMVAYFTFALNYRIHGNEVVGYHVVNLAIHIINGFLVYFLVLLTFKTPYFAITEEVSFPQAKRVGNPSEKPSERLRTSRSDKQGFTPLFAALLFVSHPVQTQAVTYIVQRLASLATLFYLLSLVMYVKGRLRQAEAKVKEKEQEQAEVASKAKNKEQKKFFTFTSTFTLYCLSFVFAVLTMKTKEIAFTLPLMIALYEFLFFMGPIKKRVLYLVPFLLLMLIIPLELMGLEKPAGAVMGEMDSAIRASSDMNRWEYLFTEFRVIVTYLRLLIFPVNQNLDYDYPVYHSFFDLNVFLSFLFLLALFGIGVYLVYKSRIDNLTNHRGIASTTHSSLFTPHLRFVSFGIFWFFITLSVESGVIPIADVIFEHRLYLPTVGFFIAVTAVFSLVWERVASIRKLSFPLDGNPSGERLRTSRSDKQGYQSNNHPSNAGMNWQAKIAVGVFGVIIVIFSGATYARNNLWRDEVSLWEDVVKKSPSKVRPHSNLGHFYGRQGRLEEAVREYQTALRLDPDDFQVHNNLGVIYKWEGRAEEAIREYRKALRLKPDDAMGYYNLGNIFREQGNFEEAIKHYQAAIQLEPEIEVALLHNNLGIAFIGQGNKEAAAREFRTALDLDPGYEAARRNLEMLLKSGGR